MSQSARQHVRVRLTIRQAMVFGSILLVYIAAASIILLVYTDQQLDVTVKEDLELIRELLPSEPGSGVMLKAHRFTVSSFERFLEVWTMDGRLVYRSPSFSNQSLGPPPSQASYHDTITVQRITLQDGSRWRLAESVHTPPSSSSMILRLAISEEPFYEELRRFAFTLLLGVPLGLLVVTISSYLLVRRALLPVDTMTALVHRINAGNLKTRVPVEYPGDELGRLANAFNKLLDRIACSFESLKRFTEDASHELRTPLTVMRSVGEVGLRQSNTPAEFREVIGSMLEENARLTRLVDSLLLLTRADAGKVAVAADNVDLASFVREMCDVMLVLAEEKQQTMNMEIPPVCVVRADTVLLRMALLNLLDNAIKFSPIAGVIRVRVSTVNGAGVCEIGDSGPGIPPDEQRFVFDRLYRVEKGRSRQTGGAGLGLAIVRWAIESMEGRVELESDGHVGSLFRIVLPHLPNTPLHISNMPSR